MKIPLEISIPRQGLSKSRRFENRMTEQNRVRVEYSGLITVGCFYLKANAREIARNARLKNDLYHLLKNSPIDLRKGSPSNLYYADIDARTWIWRIKNTLRLSVARFNIYNIYKLYLHIITILLCAKKCCPFTGHQSVVLEIRDREQQDLRSFPSSSRFQLIINNSRGFRS